LEQSLSVEAFVQALFASINDGAVEAFDDLVSPAADVRGIGSDPGEMWWDGWRRAQPPRLV
jgi:hypothetical protein